MRRICLTTLIACALVAPATKAAPPFISTADCAGSLAAVAQLKAKVERDSALATLADSLTDSAQPLPTQLDQVESDSLQTLDQAGDEIVQQGDRTAEQLRAGRFESDADSLSRALKDLREAQNVFRRRRTDARIGGGARVIYEAVETYQHAIESFGVIRAQSAVRAEGGYRVVPATPDAPPPPNPSTDPRLEGLRALRAHESRARLAALGYRSIGALRARQTAQAKQLAGQMRQAAQSASQAVRDLEQLAAPCHTAAPTRSAKKGGKVGTSLAVGLGAAGAAAYLAGKALSQAQPAGSSGTGSSGSGTPRVVSFSNPWICSGATCTGRVTINFPAVMSSGSIIVISSSGFSGQKLVSPTSPPGDQTFDMSRPYNVNCYQAQRELTIWNASNTNGPQTYALTGLNIPVSCQ